MNYLIGVPAPLKPEAPTKPSTGTMIWCTNLSSNWETCNGYLPLTSKFIQIPKKLFCNFYKSVGCDENHYRSYALMIERTPNLHMQVETQSPNKDTGGVRRYFQGWRGEGETGRGHGQVICYNREKPEQFMWDFLNPIHPSYQYCRKFNHSIEDCPMLIAKMK